MKILIRDDTGLRELTEEDYADEVELQQFLKEHADLMPLEDIDLSAPRLLCIGWEVGLASGAEDILYIDSNGMLTVVETKLRKNSESRREVVGQILEYAAQMSTWTSGDVERQAEKFFGSEHSPKTYRRFSLRQAMESHVQSDEAEEFDYDLFLEQVQEHIDTGSFRLVIAIDEPPVPLLKTVEFVNRFSRHFELYLVQLKRFNDAETGTDVFVPAIFGRVSPAPSGPARRSRLWDYSSFFEELEKRDEETKTYVLKAYEKFNEWTDEELWGSGTTYGSFNLVIRDGDLRVNLAAITTSGILYVNFGELTSKVPEEVIEALKADLESIDGVSMPAGISRRYPRVPEVALRDPVRLRAVLKAIKRTVDAIHAI